MKCGQDKCECDAAFLYTWPGRDADGICLDHAPKLEAVARALEMHLQLIPIVDADEVEASIARRRAIAIAAKDDADELAKPFKPSHVVLSVPPLTGTMGHAECEHAAALLVLTCETNGDAWGPVTPKQVGEAIKVALDSGHEPWGSLNRNPFFRPDFFELAEKGFARWTETEGRGPIELTPKGLEALRRWVAPAVAKEPT